MNKHKIDIANLKVSRRVYSAISHVKLDEEEEIVTDESPIEWPPKPRLVSNSIVCVSRKYNTCCGQMDC